jgi:hypothetical protein
MKLINLFKKEKGVGDYKGLSDFMVNAPSDKKIKVFTEVSKKATEDQKKILDRVGFTLKNSWR